MERQTGLLFPILTEDQQAARLDPSNPACPFHGYVGNENVVDEAMDLAYSAFQERNFWTAGGEMRCNRACPRHIALLGPPSSGKTTFDRRFADTLELPFCETEGRSVTGAARLFEDLATAYGGRGVELVEEGNSNGRPLYCLPPGVLYIDEVHLLPPATQDSLLKMAESNDGQLILPDRVVDCRLLTFIIGTTDRGKLRKAFKTRFRPLTLRQHTVEEVARIVGIAHPDWPEDDCRKVASLKPIPREALAFAATALDAARRKKLDLAEAVEIVAEREGVHEGGVSRTAVRALELLAGSPDGLSRASLCAALSIEQDEFENDCLPCLVASPLHPAYLSIQARHAITDEGRRYLKKIGH